ncbi:hypothetical protein JB92DRAFT_2832254 [Gautieria morchelliformis]|nr:hypothetical protein JB92DRAFT_2832254 [Gautieria morchelliformis]
MYFIFPLTLAAAVLGLPHQLRNPSNGILARDAVVCPAISPFGTGPGDACVASSSGAPPSAASPAVSRRREISKRRISKRQATSTCQVVTDQEYQTSPMKSTVEGLASTNWGSDFTAVVNPSDFPDDPLHFCYTGDVVPSAFSTTPSCKSTSAQVSGNVTDGTADVAIAIVQGASATHETTVTKAVSVSSATTFTVKLGIPDIAEASLSEAITIEGSFSQGETHSTTDNNQVTTTVTAHATKPGVCNINVNVTTCTGQTSATVPAFYTGSVWFNYGTRRNGHFKWEISVDATVPAELRSSNMTLTDSITATNYGHFDSACI